MADDSLRYGVGAASGALVGFVGGGALGISRIGSSLVGAAAGMAVAAASSGTAEQQVPSPPVGRPSPPPEGASMSPQVHYWYQAWSLPIRGIGTRTWLGWVYMSPQMADLIRRQNQQGAPTDKYRLDRNEAGFKRETWRALLTGPMGAGTPVDYIYTNDHAASVIDMSLSGWHPGTVELVRG